LKIFSDAVGKEKERELMEYVVNNGDSKNYELVKVSDYDRKKSAEIKYTCQLDNQIQQFSDKWYIDLDASKQLYKSTLPDNLQVDHLPESINIKNELLDAQIGFQLEGNTIKYNKSIKVLKSILKNKEFENWNVAIKKLNKFYGDQLILKNK